MFYRTSASASVKPFCAAARNWVANNSMMKQTNRMAVLMFMVNADSDSG